MAVEERDAELGFQAGDRSAEGGLGDAQLRGGPAHVLVPGHRLEVAQLQQVHDRHFMRLQA